MGKVNYFLKFSIFFILFGCATLEPFQPDIALDRPDASRITIVSKFVSTWKLGGEGVPYGKLFINSQPQGTFLKTQRIFTKEFPPGPLLVSVCPDENQCVKLNLNLKPSTHYFIEYNLDTPLSNLGGPVWTISLVNSQNYQRNSKENSQNNIKIDQNNLENDNLNSMIQAKQKCLSLGFKLDTEEFGKCILTITK